MFLKKWLDSFCVLISWRVLNNVANKSTIIKPIIERNNIISNVSSSKEISRPDTAIAENETTVPVIQKAACIAIGKDLTTQFNFKKCSLISAPNMSCIVNRAITLFPCFSNQ